MNTQHTSPNQYPGPPPVKPLTREKPPRTDRKRLLAQAGAGVAVLALGGLLGASAMHYAGPGSDAHTACVTAVEASDQAINLYSEAINEAANGIDAVASNNSYRLQQSTNTISDLSDELYPVLTDYYLAQDTCLNN